MFPHPCLYAGDFNCHHADWGYDDNSPDGECLAGWASIDCLALLYNAKDAASFYSGCWNTGTNPDLAFASIGPNSHLLAQVYSSLAATALLAKLDRKRRDRWFEAVRSVDFSHSSGKVWSILNNRTGRSRHSPRHCLVSVNAIASQLVRNGKYKAVDRKSPRLVSQQVSDLWRATTPKAVNISENFSQREFTAALQHLKPGKAPGPDSICSELILHAGAALKFWLRDFISSCLHRLKIPQIWRRALVVTIPKPAKPVGDPKSY